MCMCVYIYIYMYIYTEVHQNFTRSLPELHRHVTRISSEFRRTIESEHLKQGEDPAFSQPFEICICICICICIHNYLPHLLTATHRLLDHFSAIAHTIQIYSWTTTQPSHSYSSRSIPISRRKWGLY